MKFANFTKWSIMKVIMYIARCTRTLRDFIWDAHWNFIPIVNPKIPSDNFLFYKVRTERSEESKKLSNFTNK